MNKQSGYGLTGGLLIVFVITIVGFAGYTVWNNSHDDKTATTESPQQDSESTQKEPAEDELSKITNGLVGQLLQTVDGRSCEANSSRCYDLKTALILIDPPFEDNYFTLVKNLEAAGWSTGSELITAGRGREIWNASKGNDNFGSLKTKASFAFSAFSLNILGDQSYIVKGEKVAIIYADSYSVDLTESEAISSIKIYNPAKLSDNSIKQIYSQLKSTPEKVLLSISTSTE